MFFTAPEVSGTQSCNIQEQSPSTDKLNSSDDDLCATGVSDLEENQAPTEIEVSIKTADEAEISVEVEDNSKHCLLNRLFKFLDQPVPLNPVLAGYFSRTVQLLLQRRQNLMVPYLLGKIELLVSHSYSASVTEVLQKFLMLEEQNFAVDLQILISQAKIKTIGQVIKQMGEDANDWSMSVG